MAIQWAAQRHEAIGAPLKDWQPPSSGVLDWKGQACVSLRDMGVSWHDMCVSQFGVELQ